MQNNGNYIKLNFIPISVQEFNFKVYRIEYIKDHECDNKIRIGENAFRYTLPAESDVEIRKEYIVSFQKINPKFEEFICNENYNLNLSKKYIFQLLLEKIKKSFKSDVYFISSGFQRKISIILKKHNEGDEIIFLEPYILKTYIDEDKLIKIYGFLIDFRFKRKLEQEFNRKIMQLSLSLDKNYKRNRNFYQDKLDKIKDFLIRFKDIIFPLSDDINEFSLSKDMFELPTKMLNIKEYIFGKDKSNNSQYKGLQEHGPLEAVSKNINLVYVYEEKNEYLIHDLRNAIRGLTPSFYFSGFSKFFSANLEKNDIQIKENRFSINEMNQVINKIVEYRDTFRNNLIMPIIILDKENIEQYYHFKYYLLKKEIPIQVVTTQLLRSRESLKWAISNISLGIFAKLGGKPWKVKPSNENCVIFGIGQSHQKKNNKIERYYAYSVSTESSGLYKKVDVLSKSNSETNYLTQLKKSLINLIREYIKEDYNHYVLHIPFKIKRKELDVINSALVFLSSETSKDSTDFIVLRVNAENKYFGYANTNSLVPYESSYLMISNNPKAYLVWFEGLQYHNPTIHKQIPGPIYIEFLFENQDLTEKQRIAFLQDVLNLSGANWRGFNAKNLPISIYYCQLIAKFLKKFPEEIDNLGNVTNPWFL